MPQANPAVSSDRLLPDPEPRPAKYRIVSVDDHLIEPPDVFAGRVPKKYEGQAPRVVEDGEGGQRWTFEGELVSNYALNAVAGRKRDEEWMDPTRYEDMRRGCWDIHARIKDMDINGVWASLNFPSGLTGFCGTRLWSAKDKALGLACMRAWNQWHHEAWAGPYPERIIPLQLPWLADPAVGAREIEHNAEKGFRAVSFCENPAALGLPSMHSTHWDPMLAACEATETVVCLHVGSSGLASTPVTAPDAPWLEIRASLFAVAAMVTAVDWIWSGVLLRYPRLKVAMSEGGLGWVPMLLDRLNYIADHALQDKGRTSEFWRNAEAKPAELLTRNFWFCTLDDPSTIPLRHVIGVDRIMIESDYPHSDTTWPDTQRFVQEQFGSLPKEEIEMITHANAELLFRHPAPDRATALV